MHSFALQGHWQRQFPQTPPILCHGSQHSSTCAGAALTSINAPAEAYVIEIELPGVSQYDIAVSLNDNNLLEGLQCATAHSGRIIYFRYKNFMLE